VKASRHTSKPLLALLAGLILTALIAPPALAVNYTISYSANSSQHQFGVVTGTVPNSGTYAAGTVITVASNSGSLARQGFSFAGWNTVADGSGTTYSPGLDVLTVNSTMTLYAKWTIPDAAHLIGNGGSLISISNPNSVANSTVCTTGNYRGITSDGTYIYYRTSNTGYICKVDLTGKLISVNAVTSLPTTDNLSLTYSNGCIFIRSDGAANANINCIDISDWSLTALTLSKNLLAGSGWLTGNLIDFPDGRIGAVGAPSAVVGSSGTNCPIDMYCKVLRLFNVIGKGKNVSFTDSEDITLADSVSGWPSDEHGIATDGTYLYEIMFGSGYKVWALRSGAASHIVFNGSGTGLCTSSTAVSGSLCPINSPINGSATTIMSNATFLGHNHLTNQYIMGDYEAMKFYLSGSAVPPAGPGSLPAAAAFNSFSLAGSVTSATYRQAIVITANMNAPGKVTFKLSGKAIPGCRNVATSGTSPNITATCSWRPAQHGYVALTATAVPLNSQIASATSAPFMVAVATRSGKR